jgi:polyphosphate glucokinase
MIFRRAGRLTPEAKALTGDIASNTSAAETRKVRIIGSLLERLFDLEVRIRSSPFQCSQQCHNISDGVALASKKEPSMKVLVIDVGGHHVKILLQGQETRRKFESGPKMTVQEMVEGVRKAAEGWSFDVVSLGYPGPVLRGRPVCEPRNLAPGWVGFDFEEAFGCPVKLINDAAMQALGSYQGGRMLFLGLGTGLGSAMIVDGIVEPMELAHLPFRKATFEDYVGERGLKRLGAKRWRRRVAEVVETLSAALQPTDVVIGGGNVKKLKHLPPNTRAGDNDNAFTGGFRLWETGGSIQTSFIAAHGAGKTEEPVPREFQNRIGHDSTASSGGNRRHDDQDRDEVGGPLDVSLVSGSRKPRRVR